MVQLQIWAENMAESKVRNHKCEKREIRKTMSRLRRELDPEEKQRMDEAVCQKLLNLFDKTQQTVYCYVSYGTEPDTLRLIERLWEQGVPGAVPRVEDEETHRMNFYRIRCMKDLVPGYKGILEPAAHCRKAEERQAPVVTPGLAFSRSGERLGYGGGYYDRFFADEPEHLRIAVAYPFQILDALPTEDTDFRVGRIVTGERVYECGTGGR